MLSLLGELERDIYYLFLDIYTLHAFIVYAEYYYLHLLTVY